jgi:hypothetical protein
VALCVLALSAPSCPAQAQRVSLRFAQGTHLFRRILHDLNLVPLRDFGQLAEPAGKVLIVLGETESVRRRLNLGRFVEQGGAVLLATDRNCDLPPFGVKIVGDLVTADKLDHAYKSADCVFLRPASNKSFLFANLWVERDISHVATNRPGYLVNEDSELQDLATFPRGCVPERIMPFLRRRYRDRLLPCAAGGDFGQGRILILSDHSIFINAMMWQSDIENFDFAYNCVNWLTRGGTRKEVLFLEEGEIQQTFEIPLKEPPLPPLKAIVQAVDKGLGELETDNVFNRAIHNAVTELTSPQDRWLQVVVVLSTTFLGMVALARISQARHRPDRAAPLPAPAPARLPPPNLRDQRHQSMEQDGNYWEAARALARRGIESALGASAQSTPSLASLGLQGGWWRNWRQRRRLDRLWQLAYGTEPVWVSSRQLARLSEEIEKMKAVRALSNLRPGEDQSDVP